MNGLFHRFDAEPLPGELPERFNNPFHYRPHALCVKAADAVRARVAADASLSAAVACGKMFGVLVVRSERGEVGFLAAFSGIIDGRNSIPGFVPPVFDFLSPDGYFKREEGQITEINRTIKEREGEYQSVLDALRAKRDAEIDALRRLMAASKRRRDEMRATGVLSAEEGEALVRESQREKADMRRLKNAWDDAIKEHAETLQPIEALREERKQRSAALQTWLFEQFEMLNAMGQKANLIEIFSHSRGVLPPGGAGECAAPKLLQYAYKNALQPLAMAEFWIGATPSGEMRRDGCYYGSCMSKCAPILDFMLRGIDVEPSRLDGAGDRMQCPRVVYDDAHIVVAVKPSGMLSSPGKVGGRSAEEWLQEQYGTSLRAVHRLDMATSGLLLMAKDITVYKALQRAFALGEVEKRYSALLCGSIDADEGEINVPLAPDYENRPMQKVDYENGKPSVTRFKVRDRFERDGKKYLLLSLYPLTGRTHQLRLHCACPQGLNTPIVGDELYGTPADRLMLHAEYLSFRHPITGEKVEVEDVNTDFCTQISFIAKH